VCSTVHPETVSIPFQPRWDRPNTHVAVCRQYNILQMLCAIGYYYHHYNSTRAVCTMDMYFLLVIYFYFSFLTRGPRSRVLDILYGRQRPPRTPAKWHTFYSQLAPEAFDGLIYGRRPPIPTTTPIVFFFFMLPPLRSVGGSVIGSLGVQTPRRRDCRSPQLPPRIKKEKRKYPVAVVTGGRGSDNNAKQTGRGMIVGRRTYICS